MSRNKQAIIIFLLLIARCLATPHTALHDYMAKPDPHYHWDIANQEIFEEGTRTTLKLTSQSWRSPEEVNRTLWQHWLTLYVPKQVEYTTALLFIGGGANNDKLPKHNGFLADTALLTKSVTAELLMVPNQPLVFSADPQSRKRYEDDILAFVWARQMESGDPNWLGNLPMTKSAVRAMDTITAFSKERVSPPHKVNQFFVTGASKRGWTTWLTAAVDNRVIAIAPMVIDVLNMRASIKHHYAAYGFYAEALTPYVENGVIAAMDDPKAEVSLNIIDPYTYCRNITIPKLILNSTGDQFFLPDSTRFYFKDLVGQKSLRYIPNTDHGLDETAGRSIRSFYSSILQEKTYPELTWTSPAPDTLQVESNTQPLKITLWQAHNPQARDFRVETLGEIWTCQTLKSKRIQNQWHCQATISTPKQGWTAFLLAFTYQDPIYSNKTFTLTTEVSVVPDILPYK